MSKNIFTKKELYSKSSQKSFKGDAREVAFLLGGIGTGNVSVGARGELRDWEIFNRPNKGNYLPYTFFSIWIKSAGSEPIAKILESKIEPPYELKGQGTKFVELPGLPRFDSSTFRSEYPFVNVKLLDEEIPLIVELEAFTPFIPLNIDDSSIPGTIIRYRIKNILDKKVEVSIAGSLANVIGLVDYNFILKDEIANSLNNEYLDDGILRGLFYTTPNIFEEDLGFGSMALITSDKNTTYKTEWINTGWFDGVQDFWNDFYHDGKLENKSVYEKNNSVIGASTKAKFKVGSLGIYHNILPGEEKVFEFVLTWYFPNRINMWENWDIGLTFCSNHGNDNRKTIKNYYCKKFKNAWHVGKYLISNLKRLEKSSRDFQKALYNTTLPNYVIEALANNITVLRSNTCFRIEDGTFLGWEGTCDDSGCCAGSCTHVWNYAQTLAFLFPELEQTMRRIEFNLETDDEGKMSFRTYRVFGGKKWDALPAVDGQMGTIIRLYRDWKISGNNNLIKELWHNASRALDFAFSYWDTDGDYVLDGKQHTTYDIEFYGPNSYSNSLFFAALKAGIEIAEFMKDKEHVLKYKKALEEGSKKLDELTWNGEYFIQSLPDMDNYSYQYGNGCLSDQLFGQLLAHLLGLGYILPKDHVKKAVYSIFKYNFKKNLKNHHNIYRAFALNDEKALVVCSWPKGGKPKSPFPYSEENWTGSEYQVATHLIYEGFIDEGLSIVKAIRERFDGYRRNPWNEVECGNHYVRSMASWGLLIALSGFNFDMVKSEISFSPVINKNNFLTFWSTGKAWGKYSQKKNSKTGKLEWKIDVLYGNLKGIKINSIVL